MSDEAPRVGPAWLALREPADAAARATELVGHLVPFLPPAGRRLIHDLGCGTGSMGRWLAPLLPGPQHWVLHDRDDRLLAVARDHPPGPSADGAATTVEARRSDVTRLHADDLGGATLITASALLDMLTVDELARLIAACGGAGCPVLLTLSVVGRVELTPAHPLDRAVMAAFNDHQRRTTDRGRLAGPDAAAIAGEAFRQLGAEVVTRPSPWHLGPLEAELTAEWFAGWVGAACAQRVELAAETGVYRRRRLAEASAGDLAVTVEHADLLVVPPSAPGEPARSYARIGR
jgi:hypothetical protein